MSELKSPNHTLDALVAAGVVSHVLTVSPQEGETFDVGAESAIVEKLFGILPEPIMRLATGEYAVKVATAELEEEVAELLSPRICSFEPMQAVDVSDTSDGSLDGVTKQLAQIQATLSSPRPIEWPEELSALSDQIARAFEPDQRLDQILEHTADPALGAAIARLEETISGWPEPVSAEVMDTLKGDLDTVKAAQPDVSRMSEALTRRIAELQMFQDTQAAASTRSIDKISQAVATIADRQAAMESRLDQAIAKLSEPPAGNPELSDMVGGLQRIEASLEGIAQIAGATPAALDTMGTHLTQLIERPAPATPDPFDPTPITERIDGLATQLAGLGQAIDAPKPIDMDPLTERLDKLSEELVRMGEANSASAEGSDMISGLKRLEDTLDGVAQSVRTTPEVLDTIGAQLTQLNDRPATPSIEPFDPSPISDRIDGLATQVAALSQALGASAPLDMDPLMERLDKMAEDLDRMGTSGEDTQTIDPLVIEERLEAIDANLSTLTNRSASRTEKSLELERMALTRGTTVFETILRRLDALTTNVEERGASALMALVDRAETALSSFTEQAGGSDIATLKVQNADIARAIGGMQERLASQPDLTEPLARIQTGIDALPTEFPAPVTLPTSTETPSTDNRDGLMRLSLAMQSTLRRLDAATSEIEDKAKEPLTGVPANLQDAVDGLMSASIAGQDMIRGLETRISNVSQQIGKIDIPAPADTGEIQQLVAEIKSEVQKLHSPKPTVDLGVERRGMIRLSSALQGIIRRLDAQTSELEARDQVETSQGSPELTDLLKRVDAKLSMIENDAVAGGAFLPDLKLLLADFLAQIVAAQAPKNLH
ncbi:MAG: hypothetical protein AAGE38_04345 [Pseudomonadota bacterium]